MMRIKRKAWFMRKYTMFNYMKIRVHATNETLACGYRTLFKGCHGHMGLKPGT